MAAAGQGSSASGSFSQEEVPGAQVFWAPNMGCNIRVDLTTGVPEYINYLKSPSWMARRELRTIGEDGLQHSCRPDNRCSGIHQLPEEPVLDGPP